MAPMLAPFGGDFSGYFSRPLLKYVFFYGVGSIPGVILDMFFNGFDVHAGTSRQKVQHAKTIGFPSVVHAV